MGNPDSPGSPCRRRFDNRAADRPRVRRPGGRTSAGRANPEARFDVDETGGVVEVVKEAVTQARHRLGRIELRAVLFRPAQPGDQALQYGSSTGASNPA